MVVIRHIPEGGLGPLVQALGEGGGGGGSGEAALTAAHAACLIPQQPAIHPSIHLLIHASMHLFISLFSSLVVSSLPCFDIDSNINTCMHSQIHACICMFTHVTAQLQKSNACCSCLDH